MLSGKGMPMTSPKDVAWSFFELLGQNRIEQAADLLDDDGTYWACSREVREIMPMPMMKRFYREAFGRVQMTFKMHDALVDGNRVAIEIESFGQGAIGKYNNRYCFIMTVEAGKIRHVKEYVDTKHASEILIPHVGDLLAPS